MTNDTSSWSASRRSAGSSSCSTLKIWTAVVHRRLPPPLSPPDAPPSDQEHYLLGRCPTPPCPPFGQSMTCPNTPRTPPSRPVAGLAVLLLGVTLLRRCTIEMYGWGLCVMSPVNPEIASDEGKSREHKSKGDPWPLTSLTDHFRGRDSETVAVGAATCVR